MNQNFQAGFRKSRGTSDQTVNIHQIIRKAREFQKNIYVCFIDYAKAMAPHSSTLAWQIPWIEEPDAGYCPWGCKELDTTK